MSNAVIRVENLSKLYTLYHGDSNGGGEGLRHALQHTASAPLRAARRLLGKWRAPQASLATASPAKNGTKEDFWALSQVSFEVKRGEVLGIIGRNGAGKSTLLKILSRIVEPTSGRVGVKGRIASLLEVGTGFHPELTGRENIYLNGAILGMTRAEVRRKFDEIVEFSEVEKFLDTPVKRYSSGMYVRLAFAVAAHLEPEILIVDEVLAVGDAQFQQKCMGKIRSVSSGEGRTVLFVSHTMPAIASLCSTALLLSRGSLVLQGPAQEVVSAYLQDRRAASAQSWAGSCGDGRVAITRAEVLGGNGGIFASSAAVEIVIEGEVFEPLYGLVMAIEVRSSKDQLLAYTGSDDEFAPPGERLAAGKYRWRLSIPPHTFASGTYDLCLDFAIKHEIRYTRDIYFRIRVENLDGIGRRNAGDWTDLLRPAWRWATECVS